MFQHRFLVREKKTFVASRPMIGPLITMYKEKNAYHGRFVLVSAISYSCESSVQISTTACLQCGYTLIKKASGD